MDVLGIPASEKEQAQDVPEAAGVMQHFAQRDGFAVRGNFRDIFANVVIEREEPLLGGENHAKLEAGGPVAFFVNEISVSDDSERAAGRVGLIVGSKDLVYSALERLLFFLFPLDRDGCCEGNDR